MMPSSYGASTGTRLPQGPSSLKPPRQRQAKSSTSNKDMGLEAIRARRAKLEALTAQVRLPPLAPGDPKSKENVKPNNKSLTPPSDTQNWAKPRTPTRLPSPTAAKRKPSAIPKLSQNSKPVQLYPMPLDLVTHNEPLPKIVRSDKIARTPPHTANSSPVPHSPTPPAREPTPPPRDPTPPPRQPTPPPREPTPPPREPTPPPREPTPVANKYQAEQKSRPNTRKSSINSAGKRPATSSFNDNEYQEQLKHLVGKDLNKMLADLKQQEDKKLRHETVTEVRRILSTDQPPAQALIQHGFVPPLIACLKEDNNPDIQFEACWAVTNICSGSTLDAQSIVEAGGIPVLRDILLSSSSTECIEQAVWALGNILGDYTHRDQAFKQGAVPPIISLTKKHVKDGNQALIVRNLAWSISNIFRNHGMKSLSDSDKKISMPIFEQLIHHDDKEVKADTMWSLSYIADGDESDIQSVIDTGVVPDVVQYIHSDDPKLMKVALRTIGNIITGSDEQTDYVLNSGVLPSLKRLLSSHQELDSMLVKEMIWVISNVCAGTPKQIELVIHFHLVPIIMELMQKAVPGIKKEACWAMLNITESSDVKQVKAVVMLGAVKQLCEALHPDTNESTAALCLKSLKNIKEKCDVLDNIPEKIIEAKGKENLEFWATNQNQSELAKQILDYIANNGNETKSKEDNFESTKDDVDNFFAEKDQMENNKGSHENSLTDIKDTTGSKSTNENLETRSGEEDMGFNLFE